MPDSRKDVKTIFGKAIEIHSDDERAKYLDQACAGDESLRAEVDDLLGATERAGNFLGGSSPGNNTLPITEKPGTVIGPYKLLQQIGEGGMGVVYMAEQEEPIRRKVALKIIKPGMDSRQVVARFEAERQALAMMDHQNIARVLDAGTTQAGRPYFVMELVHGLRITEYCDRNKLPLDDRLSLLVQVCQAIHHAHQKGVIHRDIKPSNVMVTLYDGQPVPKVIDFGVAKAIEHRLTEKTMFTQYGQIIGTPEYMSPEQAEMSGLDVDTRSDVYSLGVLLYELLTGTTPLSREELLQGGLDHMLQAIRDQEPPKPSLRLSESGEAVATISARRRVDSRELSLLLRGELDWIVMRALEKDRTRRYDTVSSLAADIMRHRNNEPVEASPASTAYRLRKFARRHKSLISTAAAFAAILVLGTITSTWQAIRAWNAEQAALDQTKIARTAEVEAIEQRDQASTQRQVAITAKREIERQLRTNLIARAAHAYQIGDFRHVEQYLRQARRGSQPQELGFEWYHLWHAWNEAVGRPSMPVFGHPRDMSISADGEILALADAYGGYVTLWGLRERRKIEEFGHQGDFCNPFVAFSPDGNTLAYSGDDPTRVILRDMQTKQQRELPEGMPGHEKRICDVAFSPDGTLLASGSVDGEIILWDWQSGKMIRQFSGHTWHVNSVAFSPDGKLLASASFDKTVRIWSVESGEQERTFRGHTGALRQVAFSPDGRVVVSGGQDRVVKVWALETGEHTTLTGHADEVRALVFLPGNSEILMSAGRDRTIRFWNLRARTQQAMLPIYSGGMRTADFMPNGTLVHVARTGVSWDCHVMFSSKDVLESTDIPPDGLGGGAPWLAWFPNSRVLAVTRRNSCEVELWLVGISGAQRLDPIRTPTPLYTPTPLHAMEISSEGVLAAVAQDQHSIYLYRQESSEPWKRLPSDERAIQCVAFSHDAKRLVAGCSDGTLLSSNVPTGEVERQWLAHNTGVRCTAFARDGTLASADHDDTVRVWPDASDEFTCEFKCQGSWIQSMTFSPDGRVLAIALFTGEIELWNTRSGKLAASLRGHPYCPCSVSFSADGRVLYSAGSDGLVMVWDIERSEERATIPARMPALESMSMSPDEQILAVGGRSGHVQLLRRATEEDVEAAGW